MSESLGNSQLARRASWPAVLLVCLAALGARAGYGLWRGGGEPAFDDERIYWQLSRSWLAGDGFVGEFGHRAERMPLYPWLLSWFDDYGTARAGQWVVGALGAGLVCLLAGRVCRRPVIAGLIVAFDPALAGSASLLLTETLAAAALAALWLAAWDLQYRGRGSPLRWVVTALLACVCVYARESLVLFIIGLAILLVVLRRDRAGLIGSAGILLAVVLSLVPWGMRNQRVLGEWCWFTTRGGISLYDGVRPGATGAGDLADVKAMPEVHDLREAEWDAYFRRAAWAAITNDPVRIAKLAPIKLGRTWSPVLHAAEVASRVVQVVFPAWYVPLYALILLGAWARRREARLLWYLLLPAVCVSALHCVFVGSVRYRLVAIPALAILAACGAAWAHQKAVAQPSGVKEPS